MKTLFPFINLIIAAALFFLFTDQQMVNAPLNEKVINEQTNRFDMTRSTGGIRALLARERELNAAISTAKAVGERVNELASVYNSFTADELARLDELLPDHVDNIQLIIDVNGIAKNNGMSIKNIKVASSGENEQGGGRSPAGVQTVAAPDERLGAMNLSFSVTGSYEAYKKFVADLATSLRLIDISSVSFATEEKGVYTYNVALKTYWLK